MDGPGPWLVAAIFEDAGAYTARGGTTASAPNGTQTIYASIRITYRIA